MIALALILTVMVSSILGGIAGGLMVYLSMTKKSSNNTPNLNNSLKGDPRYETAQKLFKQADNLFKKASRRSSRGSVATGDLIHQQANKVLRKAEELMDEIKEDNAKYNSSNFKPDPYPTSVDRY